MSEQGGPNEDRPIVVAPRRVAVVRSAVAWAASRAPWLRTVMGPAYRALSGPYYRWLDRQNVLLPATPPPWRPEAPDSVEALHAALVAARAAASSRPGWNGRPERVLCAIGSLGAGGSERQMVLFLAGLRSGRRGRPWLTTTVALEGPAAHFLPEARAAAEVVPLRRPRERRARAMLRDLGSWGAQVPAAEARDIAAMRSLVRRLQPAVVHAWLDWPCTVLALGALLEPVTRVVLSTRSVNPSHFPALDVPHYRALYRILLDDPRVRMCNNSTVGAADYADWIGVPRERIAVVWNGFDQDSTRRPEPDRLAALRASLSIDESAPVVVGVLRMSEEKRPLVFVEAAERVLAGDPRAVVVFVGDGVLRCEVEARVAASPHRDRFRLLGRREDAHDLIALSDVLLLTSRQEGSPNVLLEAQALGCVPISTRAGGAVDLVEEGVTGYLVAVDDTEALAQRALAVLADPALRARLRDAGHRCVSTRFGIQRMVDETLALYG